MTVKVPETKPLFEEKTELLKKLSKSSNYDSEEERESDVVRVGELEMQIMGIVRQKLGGFKHDVPKKFVSKVNDMKDARKILNKKYQEYRSLTISARELVDNLVDKKKQGRDLLTRLVDRKGVMDKKLIDDILKF